MTIPAQSHEPMRNISPLPSLPFFLSRSRHSTMAVTLTLPEMLPNIVNIVSCCVIQLEEGEVG